MKKVIYTLDIITSLRDVAKDVSKRVGDDSIHLRYFPDSFHGEGFTCASLSIRKDGAIVAFKDLFNDRPSSLVVDVKLKEFFVSKF